MFSLCLKTLIRSIETDEQGAPCTSAKSNEVRRNCTQRGGPRRDQRAICTAPRASGRPCPLLDLARSAAQIARSSLTQLNCAAVALGFRPRAASVVALWLRVPQSPHSTPTLHFPPAALRPKPGKVPLAPTYSVFRGARLRARAFLMRAVRSGSGRRRPSSNRLGLISKNCEIRANVVTANGKLPCSSAPMVCTCTPDNSDKHS